MAEKLLVPIYLPGWMSRSLLKVKRALIPPTPPPPAAPPITISGERNVEWTFLSKEMPGGPGEAFEFGCEQAYMSLMAAQKGFHVIANDLEEQSFAWKHPHVEFRRGDFLTMDLPHDHFDLVINCSSVEHVGIAGRYGISAQQDEGDIEVMHRLADILKPGGVLLMTAPCGRDAVMAPWCRVYGIQRLPKLLAPFRIVKESYWVKDEKNRWVPSPRDAALALQPVWHPVSPHWCLYALGGFVLQKMDNGSGTGSQC
jgi:SAM-dependent methyltransferase